MPATVVIFYQEKDGTVPALDWLRDLQATDRQGLAKCQVRIEQLAAFGHELRRPLADILRDGIHELRAKRGRVHYRILYFFHGRNTAVLAHALQKSSAAVPSRAIDLTVHRKQLFEANPGVHTYEEPDHG